MLYTMACPACTALHCTGTQDSVTLTGPECASCPLLHIHKGAGFREALEENEVHKIPPPSSSRRKVTVAEDGIDESRESVQDIKERMQRQIEERRSERSRRQAEQGVADDRVLSTYEFAGKRKIADFSSVDAGMGTKKKFTSRFSFMQKKDEIHELDEGWDAGDEIDKSTIWQQPKKKGLPKNMVEEVLG